MLIILIIISITFRYRRNFNNRFFRKLRINNANFFYL